MKLCNNQRSGEIGKGNISNMGIDSKKLNSGGPLGDQI